MSLGFPGFPDYLEDLIHCQCHLVDKDAFLTSLLGRSIRCNRGPDANPDIYTLPVISPRLVPTSKDPIFPLKGSRVSAPFQVGALLCSFGGYIQIEGVPAAFRNLGNLFYIVRPYQRSL